MEKFLPKLEFGQMDINREASLLLGYSKEKMWQHIFDKSYPDLSAKLKEKDTKEEKFQLCKNYIEKLRVSEKDDMKKAETELQSEWNKIGTDLLKEMSEHLQTDWSEDKAKITAYISTLPVFPRFLDEYSFAVGYYYPSVSRAVEVMAHEILHFIWFKKWKEVFPEMKREEYESPHLVWKLSEIMDPIILQCDPKIKELIQPKRWGYDSFKNIKIGEIGMTDYFKKIYLDSVADGDNFETTLKKLWNEAQIHDKEISF